MPNARRVDLSPAKLKARRLRLGLTQQAVAEAAGIRPPYPGYVSTIENGKPQACKAHIPAVYYALAEPILRRWRLRADERRIRFQRSLWAALPDHPAVRALKAAMLDRCLDLMHEGDGTECDAIAEFLPEADVERMFARWEGETEGIA